VVGFSHFCGGGSYASIIWSWSESDPIQYKAYAMNFFCSIMDEVRAECILLETCTYTSRQNGGCYLYTYTATTMYGEIVDGAEPISDFGGVVASKKSLAR